MSPTFLRPRRLAAAIAAVGLAATCAVATTLPASAAEPDLPVGAWVDSFEGDGLGADWSVVAPVPDALTVAGGALTLASQRGDTYQTDNSARNLVMVDLPAGDFAAVAQFTAPATKDFQGAGLIAWADMDNYVRAGLSHVGFAAGGPVVLENGLETAATYAATFTPRPGTTTETLRLARTGDVVTTSYWNGTAWIEAARVTVSFATT